MLPAQPNQSLIDGLAVLQALASTGGAVGSRQMARDLGLEATRVNRLLKTLAHLGIAMQTPDKQYVPGPAMHVLAAQAMFGSGLLARAAGPLQALGRFGMSVALGVLWRDQVAYLYHAGPKTKPADALGRVGLFPATRSGIGLALLARLPEADVRAIYAKAVEIPNFSGGISALLKELARVRRAGHAVVAPFADQTTRTIAVAVPDGSAAVALAGEIKPSEHERLAAAIKAAAVEISGSSPSMP